MSDTYLKIIPVDLMLIPEQSTYKDAIELLEKYTPDGEGAEIEVYENVQFIDQGENIEEIICPSCQSILKIASNNEEETDCEKVYEQISLQSENETLENSVINMPCCSNDVKTVSLKFKWPAGFSKFELSVMNPDISEPLEENKLQALEKVLKCELKQIWAHY